MQKAEIIFQICSRYITEDKNYLLFSNVRINLLQHCIALGAIVSASHGEVPPVGILLMDANASQPLHHMEAAKLTFM